MMSQGGTRIFLRNIFKKDTQLISKLNIWQNGIQFKSISKTLKQILYILTWAQIWQQRRKKWVKWLLEIQGDRWGIWKSGTLLAGVFFRFDKEGIKNEELINVFEDTQLPCSPTEYTSTSSKEEKSKSNIKWWKSPLVSNDTKNNLCENGWECLVSKSDIVIFRKPKENSAAYIYKVFGRNFDISAADFFFSQVDNSYRKTWDKYVWDIVCLGEDKESKQQLLYWVVKYPVSSKDTVYAGYKHHPLEIGYHIYSCIFIPVIRTCIATPKDVLSSYVQPASTVLKIYFYELIKRNFTRIELLNLCELLVPEN